jgi:hypothetical protein
LTWLGAGLAPNRGMETVMRDEARRIAVNIAK